MRHKQTPGDARRSRAGLLTATLAILAVGCTATLTPSAGSTTAELAPLLLDFGAQPVGQAASARTVTLTNSGTGALAISSIAASGDYAQASDCGTSLAAGTSCTIQVTFTPVASGSRPGTLTVTDDAGGSPHAVALSGSGVVLTPGATLAPSTLGFGNQPVGQATASRSVTLTSSGTGALAISSIAASGDYAQTSDCGSSLAAGAACTIQVTFFPQATGPRAGTLTVVDDAPGGPHTVALSGSGVVMAPSVAFAPSSLAFGTQPVGQATAAKALTLTNSGNAALSIGAITASGDYARTTTCGASLAAGASCTIQVTFTPQASGSRPGALTVTDNAGGSPHAVALSGSGVVLTPGATLAPSSLAFGTQPVGQATAPSPVTLTNPGTAPLAIGSISVSGDYAQTSGCGSSLAAGASCTIQVTFFPQATGARPGTLTVTDDAAGSPHTVALSGSGVVLAPSVTLAPTSLDFGTLAVGQTAAAKAVTLTNTGNAPLAIGAIAASGDYARTTTCGASLAAGASCTIRVTFTPQASGSRPGTLTVTDDAGGSPHAVPLSGSGVILAPGVSLAPPNLDFGAQPVGQTATAKAVTLTNTGNAPLAIGSITASGDYARTTTCGASLAAGAACTIQVTFAPQATGAQAGTLTVVDGAAGSPHVVALSGSGVVLAPSVALAPSSLDFGTLAVGQTSAAKPVTLTNTGTAALAIGSIAASGDYARSTTCGASLAAGASCTIQVTFTPQVGGSRTGSLTVTDNAGGSPHSVALSGSGVVLVPGVSLAPPNLDFGAQIVGQATASSPVTLTNPGTAPLAISSISVSGDYARSTTCGASLATGASCTIQVTFTPQAGGSRPGTLTVTDDAAGSPHTVALSGSGVVLAPSVALAPTSLDFGTLTVGQTSAARPVTLTNTGNAPLVIGAIAASGDYDRTSDCGSSLAAGASCTIQVTFTPQVGGSRTGTLAVTDDAGGSPHTVALSGSGLVLTPSVALAPSSLAFGSLTVGQTSAAKAVTLTNTGTAPLAIGSIAASGDYARTSDCGSSLAAGAFCTIQVTFAPLAGGSRPGTLTVTDDAAGSPHTVPLSGSGLVLAPSVALAPSSLAFGSLTVGQTSAAKAVTLTNTGTAPLAIGSIAASGDYARTSDCGTSLAAGAFCTIQVTFTPQAGGSRPGTLTVTDDAAGSPHTVALSGSGVVPAPVVALAPSSLAFGSLTVGQTSAARAVTLTNTGTAPLAIGSIAASGDYAQASDCGTSLAAGAFCTIQVAFTPLASGTRTGTLTVTDDAAGSPHAVALSGSGGAQGNTPTLVQHVGSSSEYVGRGISGNNLRFQLPNDVLAGNCLVLGVAYTSGTAFAATPITDNRGNTWPTTPTAVQRDANSNMDVAIFVLPDAAAGPTEIVVHWATTLPQFSYAVSEFSNIATASPANGFAGASNVRAPAISSGTFTPGNNDANGGNLLWSFFYSDADAASGNAVTTFAPGPGFSLLNADIAGHTGQMSGQHHATEWMVQTSAASVTPGMTATMTPANSPFIGLTVALKAASAGATPGTGIRIGSILHNTTIDPAVGAWVIQAPTRGNLLFLSTSDTTGFQGVTRVTDNKGNTWTKITPDFGSQCFYAENATSGNDLKITLTLTTTTTLSVRVYDILGAATTGALGHVSGADGDVSGQTSITGFPTFTPAAANGLTIVTGGLGQGPGWAVDTGSPPGAFWDLVTYTNETDLDSMENADFQGHVYHSTTAAQTWNWRIASQPNNSAWATAVEFKAP